MIIKRLDIISFGKFSNKVMEFNEGLNVIYGNNESGKSTIIDFIYAMFYGFGDNRGKGLSLREKYTPWSGGVCEGKISVRTNDGEDITIYRKSGAAKKYDTLMVYSNKTGEELSVSPEEIIGVSGETFLKVLCIRQLSTIFYGNNEEITEKLSNIVISGDENSDFDKAQKILENIRREIRPQRGNGGEFSKVSQEILEYEKNKEAQARVFSNLQSVQNQITFAKKELEKAQNKYDDFVNNNTPPSMDSIVKELENNKNPDSNKSSFSPLPYMIGGFFLALSFILFFIKNNFSYISFGLAILCAAAGIFTQKKTTHTNNKTYDDLVTLHTKEKLYDKELYTLKEELFSARSRLNQFEATEKALKSSLPVISTDADNLYRKKRQLEKNLDTVSLTLEALKTAQKNMQKNFTPTLNKKASKYLSHISDGKYTRIFCDEEFKVRIDSDLPRESGYFSGGTVDQVYLSLRMALADMIFENSDYTLILDQPFLQYDEERKRRTAELLSQIEKDCQILLFTCDKTLNSFNNLTQILT